MWRTSAPSKCNDGPLLGRSPFLIRDDSSASMIRGSLTEPRRKPNHDDVIWDFFLSVKLAVWVPFSVSAAIDDRTPWLIMWRWKKLDLSGFQ
ncbi:hypothetical protein CDAR_545511 [Caerostris darwini]|uniref:Uncharacterized protein n=1 Tax=Caerostris darwini TaxID=1538125 RepID=A0AAV4RPP0_9ARAC|nr:hypothetical protein CDAR_545511 [Caerostris darwini]